MPTLQVVQNSQNCSQAFLVLFWNWAGLSICIATDCQPSPYSTIHFSYFIHLFPSFNSLTQQQYKFVYMVVKHYVESQQEVMNVCRFVVFQANHAEQLMIQCYDRAITVLLIYKIPYRVTTMLM